MLPLSRLSTLVLFLLAPATFAFAQTPPPLVVPLWEKGTPGFETRKHEPEKAESYWVKNVHNPTLTVFLPARDKTTGAAMVICPGGGHKELGFKGEGVAPAEYYANGGIACFVLKYRLGREEGSSYQPEIHAPADGQRAMRLVRSRAGEWNKLATIKGWPLRLSDWLTDNILLAAGK